MARSMPKGGGGGSVDWVALAESNPVVMFRVVEHLEDFQGRGGATPQVKVDMAILTGQQRGRVVTGERVIGKGITQELSKRDAQGGYVHAPGADVPVRLTVLQSYGNDYCATQVPSTPEMEVVDKLFPDGGEDEAWAKARKAWEAKGNSSGGDAPTPAMAGASAAPAASASDDAPW